MARTQSDQKKQFGHQSSYISGNISVSEPELQYLQQPKYPQNEVFF